MISNIESQNLAITSTKDVINRTYHIIHPILKSIAIYGKQIEKNIPSNNNREYWTNRWSAIRVDEAQEDKESHPLQHALEVIRSSKESILEAGCGNGRILRYFHDRGYSIEGFDFIGEAIDNLKKCDPQLRVEVGDIKHLKYNSCSFDCILAFGLYHNLEEDGLTNAIKETARIMKDNARLCASFRADNFQNRINDFMADRKCAR